MRRLTVACVSADIWGTNYYRGTLVKRGLARRPDLGIDLVHTHLFGPGLVEAADVMYFLRPLPTTVPIEVAHALKRAGKPIVVDFDDDYFHIPEWSMSAISLDKYGVKEYYRRLLEVADVVTTTHRWNAEVRLPEITGAAPRVAPNALDEEQRLLKPQRRPKGFAPSIGWGGGSQHNGDLAALDEVWLKCLEKGYSLTFLGDRPRSLEGRDGAIVQIAGTPDVEMYHQALALACIDVAVAPVLPIPFNRVKSSLKAVEYMGVAGAPCVLSDLECYADVDEDGARVQKVAGFDAREWMAAIERGVALCASGEKNYHLPERFRLGTTVNQWAAAFRDAHQIVTEG